MTSHPLLAEFKYSSQELSSSTIGSIDNDELTRCSMEELRSSTKAEVLKAWAEVERVEDEKVEILDRNLYLLNQLRASAERERALERQVEELKRDGTCTVGIEMKNKPHPFLRMFLADAKAKTALVNRIKVLDREKQDLTDEFKKQTFCRETMLQSMTQVQEIQREMTEKLRQQLIEQELEAHQQAIEMKQKIQDLKTELFEKRKYIARQEQKLKSYRHYIADLNPPVNELMHSNQQEKLPSYRSYITDLKPPANERMQKRDLMNGDSTHSASTTESSISAISS